MCSIDTTQHSTLAVYKPTYKTLPSDKSLFGYQTRFKIAGYVRSTVQWMFSALGGNCPSTGIRLGFYGWIDTVHTRAGYCMARTKLGVYSGFQPWDWQTRMRLSAASHAVLGCMKAAIHHANATSARGAEATLANLDSIWRGKRSPCWKREVGLVGLAWQMGFARGVG
jgi:hypothetical protein